MSRLYNFLKDLIFGHDSGSVFDHIPLTSLETDVTQIDTDSMSSIERLLFDHLFPGFNETVVYNPQSREANQLGLPTEAPYNYRRFAGGPDLPRGCYYAVGSSSGDATNILLHEVLFYIDPRKTSGFHVVMGIHPWFVDREGEHPLGKFADFEPDPSSLVVLFHSTSGLHPLLAPSSSPVANKGALEAFVKAAPMSSIGVIAYEIPVKTTSLCIDGVFDLRRPESQRTMNTWLRTAVPGLWYYYTAPDGAPPSADVVSPPPERRGLHIHKGYWPKGKARINSRQLKVSSIDDGKFIDLLNIFMYPGRGGSPITEAVGAALRASGVNALIYPSSRCNVVCEVTGEDVSHWEGWCMVDYRGSKRDGFPRRQVWDPAQWAVIKYERSISLPPEDSKYVGSWKFLGPALATEHMNRSMV